MNMTEKTRQRGGLVIIVMLSFITLVGFIKSIFVSLDIDESYAIAQAYRLAMGDRLLTDMWEPHQFSAVPIAWFIKLYLLLFRRVDYLVIVLRTIGTLIHIGVGVLLLRTLRKMNVKRIAAFSIFFIHLNFLPKWVQMPEFELIHYWMVLLIAICMTWYFGLQKQKVWIPFMAGIFLVVAMLCYPTMILLYPGYVVGWIVMERKLKGAVSLTMGSLLSGGAFMAYLCSYQAPDRLMENVSYIFMDKSHTTYTFAQKWCEYGKQILQQFKSLGAYYAIALTVLILFIYLYFEWMKHKAKTANSKLLVKLDPDPYDTFEISKWIEAMIITACLSAAILLNIQSAFSSVFQDKNQFYLQIRYIMILLPAIFLSIRYRKKMRLGFYAWILPALASLVAVLMVTNMDTNTSYAKMFPGVLGSLLIYYHYFEDLLQDKKNTRKVDAKAAAVVQTILHVTLLGTLFVCRLLLIRVTGCMPVTVKAPLIQMNSGAEKGIFVLAQQGGTWNENYKLISSVVEDDDKVLYIGAENLVYLTTGAKPATPSTQGTNVYDEMFLRYFELHPEHVPNVVIFDKTYETNPVYGNYFGWEPVKNWVEANFKDAKVIDTDLLTIWKLEE